jgi:hypothetical protein
MADTEITQNQRQYLSWKIMATALEFIDQNLYLADLHPGDGQYDCLSLITVSGEVVLMLNREGTSATSKSSVVSNIWSDAIKNGIRSTTMDTLTELDIEMTDAVDKERSELILTCKRMARWVQHKSKNKGKPVCCWTDNSYYVGPNKFLIEQVQIPTLWTKLEPPSKNSDWSAWLFALTIDEKVVAMVNMKTGDAINSDGTKLTQWYSDIFAIPKAVKQKVKVVSLPDELPTEEVMAIFRKVSMFNGYKVFGDQLANIAETISAEWHKSGELPSDIEQIKGALFFEWRRNYDSGYPPKGRDLRYLQALGTVIDKHSKG